MPPQRRTMLARGRYTCQRAFRSALLTGVVEPNFTNPHMWLAAHLEGVMNGTFLVAIGAVWTGVRLSSRPRYKKPLFVRSM